MPITHRIAPTLARFRRTIRAPRTLALTLTLCGCASIDGAKLATEVSGVSVDPSTMTLNPGDTLQAIAWINHGLASSDLDLTGRVGWRSLDAGIASVDWAGFVRAIAVGHARITASYSGHMDTVSVTVVSPGRSALSVAAISVAADGACGIEKTSGHVICWGAPRSHNGTSNPGAPKYAAAQLAFTSVTVARSGGSTCALDATRIAWCWDQNASGSSEAVRVAGTLQFKTIGRGTDFFCGLSVDSEAWCWGENSRGTLGNGSFAARSAPDAVAGGHKFVKLAVGEDHSCGLTADGVAWCWGANLAGALGDGGSAPGVSTPVMVLGNIPFSELSATMGVTCGLGLTGIAYCWGAPGRVGRNSATDSDARTPTPVAYGLTFAALAAGGSLTCGLTTSGEAYCWGGYFVARSTHDEYWFGSLTPFRCGGSLRFASISTAYSRTCATTTDSRVYCWGMGPLGDGTTANRYAPVEILWP